MELHLGELYPIYIPHDSEYRRPTNHESATEYDLSESNDNPANHPSGPQRVIRHLSKACKH